ncbi:Gp19/Gp15/Gp42 family protein [Corynebacterium diphtheriae]
MVPEITPDDVSARLATPLVGADMQRAKVLISDSLEIIRLEFLRAGRDFDREVTKKAWLGPTARFVVLEMVSAAALVGGNVGQRSATSTTGPQSDSVTWADVGSVTWSGVLLTDVQRERLGLAGCGPRGNFPKPLRWPEIFRGR